MKTVWTSPIASQEIVTGPEVTIQPGATVIRYCDTNEDWHELTFSGILFFSFTEFGACREEHVDAYDKLLELGTDTPLAKEILSGARSDIKGMRHYRIFFDEVGAYDIIARNAKCP